MTQVTVIAKGQPETFTLVGMATFGELSGLPGSTLVAVERRHRPASCSPSRATTTSSPSSAADGVDNAELSARVDAALGRRHLRGADR